MKTSAASHALLTASLLAALTPALPAVSRGSELGASAPASAIVIHDSQATLRDYCRWESGKLYLELPGGTRYELVTSTTDEAITNPGDGAFHPFDASVVQSTLDAVRFPIHRLGAEVFLLPYPRRLGLDSAAGPGLVLLSPGVRPLSLEQQHSEIVHELGHVVQYAIMPDSDGARWNEYRTLRGISDEQVYSAGAVHHDRPHEIFAEDFRVLCGDALANYAGTIENSSLAYPTQVSGLPQFVARLGEMPLAVAPLGIVGDGHRGTVRFTRGTGAAAPLDLYDVSGRRLAALLSADGASWLWDGRDLGGRPVTAALVFARARDGAGGVVRITRLP